MGFAKDGSACGNSPPARSAEIEIQAPRLGVVTPLGNERATVERFMDAVLARLCTDDRWYCVLDRVSTDGTREIVEDRSRSDERLVYLWVPESRCVVDAYFAGYRAAYSDGCRWILEMDAGFSHPPDKIPEFVAAMEGGYDFAASSRFMPGGEHRSPWNRRFLSYGGTLLSRLVLGSQMTDMTGGYECFSRRAMEHLLKHPVRSRANFFQTEIRHAMHQFPWKEIPIVYVNDRVRIGRRALLESFRILLQMGLQR
jgi:dolichol-phosphate mannosyltransferase